jgi:hypothetical protein
MRRGKECLWVFAAFCLIGLGLLLSSCTPDQAARIEKGLTDANLAAGGINDTAQGPAGSVLPRPVVNVIGIAALLLQSGLLFWLKNKNALIKSDLKTSDAALGAVVKGVETLSPEHSVAVKEAVGEQMAAAASESTSLTYSKLNAAVDAAKV